MALAVSTLADLRFTVAVLRVFGRSLLVVLLLLSSTLVCVSVRVIHHCRSKDLHRRKQKEPFCKCFRVFVRACVGVDVLVIVVSFSSLRGVVIV